MKRFFPSGVPLQRTKGLHKNMVNERSLCNPSNWFWKDLNLSVLPMSNVFNEWKSRCHVHDPGGLSSSQGYMKYQVEQLNKIGVAAMEIGIGKEAGNN